MIPRTGRFSRGDRLRRSQEYQRVSRQGRRAGTSAFVMLTAEPPRGSESDRIRLGVTVSRRVGNSVVRNRVKRRIREWFRSERGGLGLVGDIVVIARPQAATLEFAQMRSLLTDLAREASS